MSDSLPKVWLISGSTTGFGRALVEKVLSRGDRVIAASRRPEALKPLEDEFSETFRAVGLDLKSPEQIDQAVKQATAVWGQIDVLVNNAGYGLLAPLEEIDSASMMELFQINFFAAVCLMQRVLPHMRARRQGHIINMSAAAAISNYAGFSIYGASKAALATASEALALEAKGFGVKVTLVEPGPFRTNFIGDSLHRFPVTVPEYEATVGKFSSLLERMNGRQPGDPDKAAEAIIAVTEAANPPFRLVLGKYAIDKTEKTLNARLRELEASKQLGLPTEFA
jgi:short-subunit dehydrogenase